MWFIVLKQQCICKRRSLSCYIMYNTFWYNMHEIIIIIYIGRNNWKENGWGSMMCCVNVYTQVILIQVLWVFAVSILYLGKPTRNMKIVLYTTAYVLCTVHIFVCVGVFIYEYRFNHLVIFHTYNYLVVVHHEAQNVTFNNKLFSNISNAKLLYVFFDISYRKIRCNTS